MKAGQVVGAVCMILGTASLLAGVALGARLHQPLEAGAAAEPTPSAAPTALATPEPTPIPTPEPTPTPTPRSYTALEAQVQSVIQSSGAEVGVTLIELGGAGTWSLNGDESFVAASTYKLPLLMEEAQDVAVGSAKPTDTICYDPGDWEDGWFSDYAPGVCFTRAELDHRIGTYSDNTAAHMLVRADGGGEALNAYARAHGATESEFWDPNVTTSSDLARLWRDEATGHAGGAAAQQYLYPLLTNTAYEDGIPAGAPSGTTVVHKIGILDGEINDAALILNGPHGQYVLSVTTEGGNWSLVASVSRLVAQFEAT
ncbi:MAG TPA: serine hydrolase [Candidatus Dormibacteraeota bacterium]|nr:serine hydrolase [Candidatus Dormibacteraeota bacterium]